MRNFLLDPKNDGPVHARNKIIAKQDIDILLEVKPTLTPMNNTREVMMPADKAILTYRQWLQKFDNNGWRIDIDEFNRRNGKTEVFTIPSPDRKQSGNWVLETMPLLKGHIDRKIVSVA